MSESITGRVALVTGAARGQGRAHAVRLAAEGADVIAVDMAGPLPPSVPYDSPTPDDLAETARLVSEYGRRAITAVVDVRELDALKAAVDEAVADLGRLDVIVANAGICSPAPWDQITAQAFRETIDTNVIGTWNTVMAGAHHIIDGGRGGSIILIGSAAGIKMQSFMVHYTASKHAVVGMARAFAAELGRYNIRVNSLNIGWMASDGEDRIQREFHGAPANWLDEAVKAQPFGRLIDPREVARAIAFLASEESGMMTGAIVNFDQSIWGAYDSSPHPANPL